MMMRQLKNNFLIAKYEKIELQLIDKYFSAHETSKSNVQGPKLECKHLILSRYLGKGAFALKARLPNYSKFCENSESVRVLKLRPTQKRIKRIEEYLADLAHAPLNSTYNFEAI